MESPHPDQSRTLRPGNSFQTVKYSSQSRLMNDVAFLFIMLDHVIILVCFEIELSCDILDQSLNY